MKVLLSWLKEFAPFEASIQTIADDLADLGLNVEEIIDISPTFSGVVVAEVLATEPHPNADRIQLVDVSTGGGKTYRVCCGAFNMSVGDLVPLATVGAILSTNSETGDLKITKREIRGETSEGMICSAPELQMGQDSGGIMILPNNLEVGTDLADVFGADTLFDLEINPNRPDAMSVAGVARDLAARQRIDFAIPTPTLKETTQLASEMCKVEIQAPDFCQHFTMRVLTDVKIKPSPINIARRLLACGMRPLNNIVDISNYVMLELGQPTHSFDLDKLPEGKMTVRMAREGEKVLTLDEKERKVTTADGIISNISGEPISIAGVMGGISTEISDSTKNVLMEAAWWRPIDIARTSRRMGLRSEASARFERGVDVELAELALDRIAELAQAQGISIAKGYAKEIGSLEKSQPVKVSEAEIKRHLGDIIDMDQAKTLLQSIGFGVKQTGKKDNLLLTVEIPSFRPDTETAIDVIEEIARTHSYKKFPLRVPHAKSSPEASTGLTNIGLTKRQQKRREIIRALKGFGLYETISLPFLEESDISFTGLKTEAIAISSNATANESEEKRDVMFLRPYLGPGILKALSYNVSHQNHDVNLFEIGKIFNPSNSELPDESEHLAIALSNTEPLILSQLLTELLPGCRFENQQIPGFHPVRAAGIFGGEQGLGIFGQVESQICKDFNLATPLSYAELHVGATIDFLLEREKKDYVSPIKYPATNFDLAFWVGDISASKLYEALRQASRGEAGIVCELNLFDEHIEGEKRGLAYSFKISAPDRTLTDEEAQEIRQACIEAAQNLGAEPRI